MREFGAQTGREKKNHYSVESVKTHEGQPETSIWMLGCIMSSITENWMEARKGGGKANLNKIVFICTLIRLY